MVIPKMATTGAFQVENHLTSLHELHHLNPPLAKLSSLRRQPLVLLEVEFYVVSPTLYYRTLPNSTNLSCRLQIFIVRDNTDFG